MARPKLQFFDLSRAPHWFTYAVCLLIKSAKQSVTFLVGHFDTEVDAIYCSFCYAPLFDRSILTKENFESDVPFHSPFKKASVSLR